MGALPICESGVWVPSSVLFLGGGPGGTGTLASKVMAMVRGFILCGCFKMWEGSPISNAPKVGITTKHRMTKE